MRPTDARWNQHVVVENRFELFRAGLLLIAGPHESPRGLDIGLKIIAAHVAQKIRSRPIEGRIIVCPCADVIYAGNAACAVGLHIVAHDAARIGPAHQHGPPQVEGLHDAMNIIGKQPVIGIARDVHRFFRSAMAANVKSDQAKITGEFWREENWLLQQSEHCEKP